MNRYKILARQQRGDDWQDFTGSRVTTFDTMVEHIKKHLIGFNYQFGIFEYVKTYNKKYKQDRGAWVLKQWYDLKVDSVPKTVISKDRKLKMSSTKNNINKYGTKGSLIHKKLRSIRRYLNGKTLATIASIQLVQAQPEMD